MRSRGVRVIFGGVRHRTRAAMEKALLIEAGAGVQAFDSVAEAIRAAGSVGAGADEP